MNHIHLFLLLTPPVHVLHPLWCICLKNVRFLISIELYTSIFLQIDLQIRLFFYICPQNMYFRILNQKYLFWFCIPAIHVFMLYIWIRFSLYVYIISFTFIIVLHFVILLCNICLCLLTVVQYEARWGWKARWCLHYWQQGFYAFLCYLM